MRIIALLALFACSEDPVDAPLSDLASTPVESVPEPARVRQATTQAQAQGEQRRKVDSSGLLGSLAPSPTATTSGEAAVLGGSVGAKGVAVGAGGLGVRGVAAGRSGYGKGGGAFGSRALPSSGIRPPANRDRSVSKTVLTDVDPLSTFAIDVDTASFAITRAALDRGSLPPQSSVRIEEFVNAQSYGYPPPGPGEGPFAVSMEAAPHPLQPGHHVLRVGIEASAPPVDRDPVHLTFLVDVSGSMSADNKLPLAKEALAELVRNLDPEDRVALVTYAGRTEVVLPPTRVATRDSILAAIERLGTGGGTAMGSGMQLAYDLAMASYEPGTENRVVVLSDGDANIGRTSHEAILDSLSAYADKGITLSTVGFGYSSNDALMEQLADKGDGNYHHIDRRSEARRVFGVHLAGTLRTVARDVKIQVDFDPASVLSYRLLGYENRAIADDDFRDDAVDAGEIGSGHTVTALYDVVLRDAPAEHLATVRVRSKLPGPDAPATERSTRLPSAAVRSGFASASPDLRVAVASALFAGRLRGDPSTEELDLATLRAMVVDARRSGDEGLVEMITKAERLDGRQAAR